MKIFVINLERRLDRWFNWQISAKHGKVENYERWNAVDGRTLVVNDEIKNLFRNIDFKLGVMGCALSHYEIWQHIIKNQLEEAIIFEDDAIFATPLEIPKLPPDWDLFYFGGALFEGEIKIYLLSGEVVSEGIIKPNLKKHWLRTFAYMISQKGAIKLVNRVKEKGFYKAVDSFMIDAASEMNIYSYNPLRVYATTEDTDIQLF